MIVNSLGSISPDASGLVPGVHLPAGPSSWCWVLRDMKRPLLIVVPDQQRLGEFVSDWEALMPGRELFVLAEIPLTHELFSSEAVRVERGHTAMKWKDSGECMVTTPPGIMAPILLSADGVEVGEGLDIERDGLLEWALRSGYKRSDLVWQGGQFVSRGSIVDIFDPSYRYPLRIEFFDDRIESMRLFDPQSQRNLSPVGITRLLSLAGGKSGQLLQMLEPPARVVFFERVGIGRSAEAYKWIWDRMASENGASGLNSWEFYESELSKSGAFSVTRAVKDTSFRIPVSEIPSFRGKLEAAESFVRGWTEDGYLVTLFSSSDVLHEWARGIGIQSERGGLSRGFADRGAKRIFLSDSDLVGITPVYSGGKVSRVPPREWEERIEELDYVIHEDYGIARNLGIERVTSGGMDRDCLVLQFAENRRLMMPLVQLFKITPYPAPAGEDQELDSLRGMAWRKAASRAREKAHEAARQIIALYAAREFCKKEPCPPDGDLAAGFESGFPFTETADQISSVLSVKRDMSSPVPMDRLLVGDVGYGKTEVAFRAAVKAVEAGRQAAFLVPTTLLAGQHHESFTGRIANLPIRAEVISRFVPKKRQDAIRRDIEEGAVDVIFGTHRLLQGDIRFRRLGLVIIDEEHRFGVLHKERLKNLDPSVDVLSISATPIPRTLHMALGGMRNISLITSPPYRRHPVMTYVGPWRDDLFRESVLREMARGGQVFFVHNRIETIQKAAQDIKAAFPGVSVDIAHGRMQERALESAMLRFSGKETDLLVCTTIIESGLDLPGANTLIVDNAQDLGLAQMYQLRGRVGRREEQAFALFFYPPDRPVPHEAMERLEAIAEMNDTGGGFSLARRDMEIRGGGQIAGTRQHGHMERVGYHSYFKMLEEEIAKQTGKGSIKLVRMDIRLPVVLPSSYVPQSSVRIVIFRRLLRAESIEETTELEKEIRERFGPIPQSVAFMIASARVRSLGTAHGLQYVRCSLKETCVTGDKASLAALFRGISGWFLSSDGSLAGPGGYRGMLELAKMI
ncbi:MAG: CarD family transcriptional regulator [Thermovirgaceae bacterium]|nr:CarD family transcriptional regulator [Thermovirgaceae bacterium]